MLLSEVVCFCFLIDLALGLAEYEVIQRDLCGSTTQSVRCAISHKTGSSSIPIPAYCLDADFKHISQVFTLVRMHGLSLHVS